MFLDSLSSKGLEPVFRMYTRKIHGLFLGGIPDEANEIFVRMEASDCLSNTFTILMLGCIHNKKCNVAGLLINEMCAQGFSVDASTTFLLLD